jgi:hypothetical protein
MPFQESGGRNFTVSELNIFGIEVPKLPAIRQIYICGTCNNLTIGSALASEDEEIRRRLQKTPHADHHVFWVGETEYYKNLGGNDFSSEILTAIIEGRNNVLKNSNVYISSSARNHTP